MSETTPITVPGGRYVPVGDTRLHIVERGDGYPLIVLHGGPGLDHTMFADYLDPLAGDHRLILVDQRNQGRSDRSDPSTWTLAQMARDVVDLAQSLDLDKYAVLGHSYGALVTLQNAVDFPGAAAQSIVSSGFPSARYLEWVGENLEKFEPVALRQQVADSWERETTVETDEQVTELLNDQLPFHFAAPLDPRIAEYAAKTAGAVNSAEVLRHFATQEYGGIEVEGRLGRVSQPTLVLAGRHDRVCSVPAAEAIAAGIPNSVLVVFENSGHMTFVEENASYVAVVGQFLKAAM
ncbi:MAG TPA: alpha/beta fold hydrolase [Anaerolineae bacterium]|nr:alpha/beta fold hydrolase [Anaerolineae bacterium]